jgi:hypothetical protein
VNRNRLIAGLGLLAVFIIIGIIGIRLSLLSRTPTEQAGKRTLIIELAYCNSNNLKPCIVSFGLYVDGRMRIDINTPAISYPNSYLTIGSASETNRYECKKKPDNPTQVVCTGPQMYPGEILQFTLLASDDDRVLAEGKFAIIGLLMFTPGPEATETLEPTETPTPTPLTIPTATRRTRGTGTPAYPNPYP